MQKCSYWKKLLFGKKHQFARVFCKFTKKRVYALLTSYSTAVIKWYIKSFTVGEQTQLTANFLEIQH